MVKHIKTNKKDEKETNRLFFHKKIESIIFTVVKYQPK